MFGTLTQLFCSGWALRPQGRVSSLPRITESGSPFCAVGWEDAGRPSIHGHLCNLG